MTYAVDDLPDFNLKKFLPYTAYHAAVRISRDFSAIYGRMAGLSIAEWRIMAHLWGSDIVSVREIASSTGFDKPMISRTTDRLLAKGLVSKRTHPLDRRLVELFLTETGREMLIPILHEAVRYQEQLKRRLGDKADVFDDCLRILSAPYDTEDGGGQGLTLRG